jgi:oligopeptide/dipeptide ABC transporter ATP-binding protein
VTIQAQILELLNELKAKLNMAVMLITHDMGVIAETAQRVVVMYAAKVVEEASAEELFKEPLHPYTQGLLRSIPRIGLAAIQRTRLQTIPPAWALPCAEEPGCVAPRCSLLPMHFENIRRSKVRGAMGRLLPCRGCWPSSDRQEPQEVLPGSAGSLLQGSGACTLSTTSPSASAGDPRPGRGVGLRQIDHRANDPAPHRADVGRGLVPDKNVTAMDKRNLRALRRRCRSSSDPYVLNPG